MRGQPAFNKMSTEEHGVECSDVVGAARAQPGRARRLRGLRQMEIKPERAFNCNSPPSRSCSLALRRAFSSRRRSTRRVLGGRVSDLALEAEAELVRLRGDRV